MRPFCATYGAIMALAPAEGMSIESVCEPGRIPLVEAGTAFNHWSSWAESWLLLSEYQEPAWLASRTDILTVVLCEDECFRGRRKQASLLRSLGMVGCWRGKSGTRRGSF